MEVVILGTGAGGGSPQWNCRCPVCALAWDHDPRVTRRTQVGFAVSMDGMRWVLFNCSPDIREQIAKSPFLQPLAPRDSPISGIVLTSGDIDHIGGLLCLREGHRFDLHATAAIHEILDRNPIFRVLDPSVVNRITVQTDHRFRLDREIEITVFATPGKAPLYLEGEPAGTLPGTTFGIEVATGREPFFYVPACADIDARLGDRLRNAALVFFDGTLWTDDEMIRLGMSSKTGRRMGHMPVAGEDGSLARLKALGVSRLIYIHINNTNPMQVEGSPEHAAVLAAGAEVGFDGQEILL
jgi:pyrroloquinoline quinone biosynthesis protein B